ncbi:MAG TPA: RpiB/LacA/LacB family sugar-phosphate isomerase [Candidatus Methylomirabilis sp.]|nr:RpiB/LacA/LacB family sugar-phosphate isomerase [Candidatus Methylomirabilis sp.]
MLTLYLGADHAGFKLKEKIMPRLKSLGYDVRDLTPMLMPGDDYPWIGRAVATKTVKGAARGILVCGSGVGVAIAANRVKGARAVEGYSTSQVKHAREHNDVNVLTLGGWTTSPTTAMRLVRVFLTARASGTARHRRRIKQLG